MAKAAVRGRLSELDALRGIAAVAVVLFHFTFGYDNGFGVLSPGKFYFKYGYLGVNLFFIISGFVIFMTLERTKDSRSFVVSRFSRLYPAYWTAIILSVLLTTLIAAPVQKDMFTTKQVLINFTMLQSWFKIKDVDGAYWTLGVELIFYFWMWLIFKIKKLDYIEWFCIAWIIMSVVINVFHIPLAKYFIFLFILNYAPLFMGGILFYLIKKRGGNAMLHLFILCSLLSEFYLIYITKTPANPTGVFDIVPYIVIVACYITFYLFVYNKLGFLSNKILLFFGTISYSLYLIHQNIGTGIIYWLKRVYDHQIFYVPVTIAVITLLSYFINKFIEKPAMKMIRNYYKTKNDVTTAPVATTEKTA